MAQGAETTSLDEAEQAEASAPRTRLRRGEISSILVQHLASHESATVAELEAVVKGKLGRDISRSSVRSYLNLHTPGTFERITKGHYRLARKRSPEPKVV